MLVMAKKIRLERATLTEMAEMCGISKPTLIDQERTGAFARGPDMKFDVAEVLEYRSQMAPDKIVSGNAARKKAGKAPLESKEPTKPVEKKKRVIIPVAQREAMANDNMSLPEAKRREARWKAERAELIFKKESGEMVDRMDVEAAVEQIATTIQMRIKNLAPKLRPHMSDAGRTILGKELDSVLREMGADIAKLAKK